MEQNTNKIIHYCWFGGAPLSELTKKCIETWKKFLPGFEIKQWNEKNFDVNGCKFVSQAYQQKKWAFVADYARFKVLEEYGGIYLDTDMEITQDISKYLDNELFMGQEDSKLINAAVVWAKKKQNKHIKDIVNIYENFEQFNPTGDLYDISVPRILTSYFEKIGFDKEKDEIQVLDKDTVTIYPMEYFYPLSYDYQSNKFTDNSCMIHHFDATWISKMEKFKTNMKRKNMLWVVYIIDFFINSKNKIKSFINHIDISIFLIIFSFMSLTALALTPLESHPINRRFIIINLLISFVLTLIFKRSREFELNRLMDLNLKEKSTSSEEIINNYSKEKEVLKSEKVIFFVQLVLSIIFMILPTFYLIDFFDINSSIFAILICLVVLAVNIGIKKKMKYRILDLICVSAILALLSVTSVIGSIISGVMFFGLLITIIAKKESKKRIICFVGSFIFFVLIAVIILLSVQTFKANYDTEIVLNDLESTNKLPEMKFQTSTQYMSTYFNFGKNIQLNLISQMETQRNILHIIMKPLILMLLSIMSVAILVGMTKDVKNVFLIIPIILVNLLSSNIYLVSYLNYIFLFITLNFILIELRKFVCKSEKIRFI